MTYCVIPGCLQPINADNANVCQSCGSKLWLRDRYRPLHLLGQGGFGRTFLAQDRDIPSQPYCVVKQLCINSLDPMTHKRAAALFHQEAVRLEELGHHPQIPGLLAHFEQNRWLYLVQDFIEGNSLEQELQQAPLTEMQILNLLRDVLPVLQFIHSRQVIHRDIKPANLMRRQSDNQIVLIDFGIAKQIDTALLSKTGTIIGTPDYMAPEQFRGRAVPASDLYSLGVTCIHLLTQTHPSELFDPIEETWRWRDRLPSNTPLSKSLEQILNKLLQSSIKQRYKAAEGVLRDLERGERRAIPPVIVPADPQDSLPSLENLQSWLHQHPKPKLLASHQRINYRPLNDALSKGKWKNADLETWAILCNLLGKLPGKTLLPSEIQRLPCEELRILNYLWLHHSRGRFGFSLQAQIYVEVGGDYGHFCDRVGWLHYTPSNPETSFTFSSQAPTGHLPSRLWVGGAQWWRHADAMARKLAQCSSR